MTDPTDPLATSGLVVVVAPSRIVAV